jgi:hypothetical protein
MIDIKVELTLLQNQLFLNSVIYNNHIFNYLYYFGMKLA